ncbi:MAG: hypothetical protein GXO79_15040 [Chlorobi bacterium]|nr:hypothetical protein [Chlorobiota bacterium]
MLIIFLNRIKKLYIISIVLLFFSCVNTKNHDEKPIVRVNNSYLYNSEIAELLPENLNPADSENWVNNYIDNWIKRMLILSKAEKNLSQKQKDVSQEINDYRATILIHRFEENLIKQRLDTVISEKDMEAYYNEFRSEFRLKTEYVKTIFVKIPKSSPEFIKISKWYKSNNEDDLNNLEDYCFQNGLEFNFDENWERFNDVLKRINYKVSSNKDFLLKRKTIVKKDSIYRYYVNIKKYKLINDIAPYSVVKYDIKSIILNRRKIQLIEEMENNVYKEAMSKNVVKKF